MFKHFNETSKTVFTFREKKSKTCKSLKTLVYSSNSSIENDKINIWCKFQVGIYCYSVFLKIIKSLQEKSSEYHNIL